MKILLILLLVLNAKCACTQSWVAIEGSKVQKLELTNTIKENVSHCFFRSGNEIIIVEKSYESDFSKLFQADTAAFELIYKQSGKIIAAMPCDSNEIKLLNISESDYVVWLHSKKIDKQKGGTITWNFVNPYSDGRPCNTWIVLKKKNRKTKHYLVSSVDKLCQI